MTISTDSAPLERVQADVLIVGLWENEPFPDATAEVDRLLDGALSDAAGFSDSADLTGKKGEVNVFFSRGRIASPRVAVVGLGMKTETNTTALREASGTALRLLRQRKVRTLASALHYALPGPNSVSAVVEGALMGVWEPGTYKSEDSQPPPIDRFTVCTNGTDHAAAVDRGRILGESANYARNLVNEPPNEMSPVTLSQRAEAMASECGLTCEILDEDEMYSLGMGGILAVSAGSENRARMVVLSHTRAPGALAVALIGKGITFDTGGISIKPREHMHEMKGDMAGAAAVLGAMRAISLLKVPLNIVGIVPCAENMPSGKAYRPGDVIRFMNHKTAEVISTDAEGRMVLADALTYAVRNLRTPRVVDVATLTGACVIALGHVATGAFGNNSDWTASVRAAGESAGEKIWELPLFEEYKTLLQSDIADMKNSGGPKGGAITGAIFLQEFVDEVLWVHLDIAGTASTDTPPAHLAKGATGVMVRTLVHLAESLK